MTPDNRYKAGICNMGEKEISVRKKFLIFFSLFVVLFTVLCFVDCASFAYWIGLMLFCFLAVVLTLEIKYKFCILFGFFNLHNFNKLGNLNEVTCKDEQKLDRKNVTRIVVQAMLVSVIYSSAIHLLAMSYNS